MDKKILIVEDAEHSIPNVGMLVTGDMAGRHVLATPTPVNNDILFNDTRKRIIVVADADDSMSQKAHATMEAVLKMQSEGCIIQVITPQEAKEQYNVDFNDSQPQVKSTTLIRNREDFDFDCMPKLIECERYGDDVKPSFTNLLPTKQKKHRNVGTYKEYVRKPKPKKTHRKKKK